VNVKESPAIGRALANGGGGVKLPVADQCLKTPAAFLSVRNGFCTGRLLRSWGDSNANGGGCQGVAMLPILSS
jgi:hypothetical protein